MSIDSTTFDCVTKSDLSISNIHVSVSKNREWFKMNTRHNARSMVMQSHANAGSTLFRVFDKCMQKLSF